MLLLGLEDSKSDLLRAWPSLTPDERHHRMAELEFGTAGCPETLSRGGKAKIVATMKPEFRSLSGGIRAFVSVDFFNPTSEPQKMYRGFVERSPNGSKTQFLSLFDQDSRKWVRYVGPGGYSPPSATSYMVLAPGEHARIARVDITENYDHLLWRAHLVMKIAVRDYGSPDPKRLAVESGCVALVRPSSLR